MKAAEYASIFEQVAIHQDVKRAVDVVAKLFINDSVERLQAKQCQTDHCLFEVLNELEQEWREFAGLVKAAKVRLDGFHRLVKKVNVDVYDGWQRSRQNGRRRN